MRALESPSMHSLDILSAKVNLISNFRHTTTGMKLTVLKPHLCVLHCYLDLIWNSLPKVL